MSINILTQCEQCNGTGQVSYSSPEGELPPFTCPRCNGEGKVTIGELPTIEDKLDSVMAEQVSQREDLTAALTQIWNKVKDL